MDLFYGTTARRWRQIQARGGNIRGPSTWGTYEVAEARAQELASREDSEPVILRVDADDLDQDRFEPDAAAIADPPAPDGGGDPQFHGLSDEAIAERWDASDGSYLTCYELVGSVIYRGRVDGEWVETA